MVQEDYHSQNPYHNAVHAADVTQAMYCYLKEPKVMNNTVFTHTHSPFPSVSHHLQGFSSPELLLDRSY